MKEGKSKFDDLVCLIFSDLKREQKRDCHTKIELANAWGHRKWLMFKSTMTMNSNTFLGNFDMLVFFPPK